MLAGLYFLFAVINNYDFTNRLNILFSEFYMPVAEMK